MAYKFRFRKSISLFGVARLNFGKKGFNSVSVGPRRGGFTVNFSKKGQRGTIGIPGTGCSWSEYTPYDKSNPNPFVWGPAPKPEPGTEMANLAQTYILGLSAIFFLFITIYCWAN